MPKFNLGYLKPKNTVWHTLVGVHVPPSNPMPVRLELKSSGRINAECTSAKLTLKHACEQEGEVTTAAGLDARDARQVKIFARHVVVGWDEVRDENLQPMVFNASDVEELLLDIAIEQKSSGLLSSAIALADDDSKFRDQPTGSPEALGKS